MRLFKTTNKLVLILTALLTLSCKEKYLETVVTDKRVDISSEWQEVVPVRPLRCERRNQEIQLYSSTPHSASIHPLGIVYQMAKLQNQKYSSWVKTEKFMSCPTCPSDI